jgi:tRNA dimethylallyltransferase
MDRILQIDNELGIQIAGPTASGKSALAVKFAQFHNGEILNADSMQVYDILDVVTARPSATELAAAPHHLYGHIAPGSDYSTGHWLKDVQLALDDIRARGKLPIFVGGTGLYFKALNGGLSNIPKTPDSIRDKWRTKLATDGIEPLFEQLKIWDPHTAQDLKPADKQRITRALEVFETTGQSIRSFYSNQGAPLLTAQRSKNIILMPERPILHERIANRFHKMMDLGAVEEVQKMLELNIDPTHTSMKAIGVREITRYLKGEIDKDAAIELSIIATRQYAKRQSTWFRNQLGDEWTTLTAI